MARYKVWIHTNKVGSECTDEIEIEDEATEEEVEEAAKDAAFNHFEWGFERIDG